MGESTVITDIRAEVEIPRDGILSRTIFEGDRLRAVAFGFDAGQELSEHAAALPAVIEILEGEAEVLVGDERHLLGAGGWIHMTAGLRHAIRAVTPLRLLLLLLPDPSTATRGRPVDSPASRSS